MIRGVAVLDTSNDLKHLKHRGKPKACLIRGVVVLDRQWPMHASKIRTNSLPLIPSVHIFDTCIGHYLSSTTTMPFFFVSFMQVEIKSNNGSNYHPNVLA